MDYILSGTFVSGVVTNIGPSGTTYELLDYGLPKPSQQWVGSAYTVNSNNNGVEEGIEVFLKFDGTDGDQLDVYAVKYIRFNTKTYREKNKSSKRNFSYCYCKEKISFASYGKA